MKKAFTLVELIVVIGIISILAGVMLVAMSNSTDAAKGAKCLANMHTLAMAVQSKAMAGSSYPLAGSVVKYTSIKMDNTTVMHGWIGWKEDNTSSSYISAYDQTFESRDHSLTNGTIFTAVSQNRDTFVCPMHREAFFKKSSNAKFGPCWSYVMNARFGWYSQTSPFIYKYGGKNYSSFKNKQKTLLFAELPFLKNSVMSDISFNTGAAKSNDPILQYQGCDGDGDEMIAFNHKTGKRDIFAHVCYADGHTERLILPRNASSSNIKEMTQWLCEPGDDFDVVLDGNQYKKLEN